MYKRKFVAYFIATSISAANCVTALAHESRERNTDVATLKAEQDSYGGEMGTLRSFSLEYKIVRNHRTVIVTPALGERSVGSLSDTAFGAGVAAHLKISDQVSIRTFGAAAEDKPVFASRQIAQDVTITATSNTTLTLGGRWSRYFGKRDVFFLSTGGRHYFNGGSVSYRLSYVKPHWRDGFSAHLVNLSLNDNQGSGKTQLWLGAGSASLDRPQDQLDFSGHDYSATLERVQPLTDQLSAIGQVGVTTFDRAGGRVTSTSVGVGVRLDFHR